MKVGTDGVLLGAWGCVDGKRILDIGTGTGLVALMAAQRNPGAMVLGIDIDGDAVQQAQENMAESPFYQRVSCIRQDILSYNPDKPFDVILCNPPFFTEDTLPDDKGRALARNNISMPFPQLIKKVASILSANGRFSVIIPNSLMQEFIGLCLNENLHLVSRAIVRTKPNKPPRRVMLVFSMGNKLSGAVNKEEEICLLSEDGNRSKTYLELTKDFYL